MTPYAYDLLKYVRSQMPKDTICELWLDNNIGENWRELTEQPSAKTITVIEDKEDE